MKKMRLVLAAAGMSFILAGCGAPENTETTASAAETQETAAETEAEEPQTETVQEEESSETETEEASQEEGFADNFEVDSQSAADFAGEIKAAVANEDIEGLADLASYPVYVSIADNGGAVESREDFVSLGAEKIFTSELAEAVEAADEEQLSPSEAGFVLSNESGRPNIIFGVVEGRLAITGMNY